MVILGYHVELVWHYVEDKSHHLPLAHGFTIATQKLQQLKEVAATWQWVINLLKIAIM